jgi:hypothetical protein
MTMWQVVCPETGWRSTPYSGRAAAERKARSIDLKIARVNRLSGHRHPVIAVQLDFGTGVDVHPANGNTAAATPVVR